MKYMVVLAGALLSVLFVSGIYGHMYGPTTDLDRVGLGMRAHHMMDYGYDAYYRYPNHERCFDIDDPASSIDMYLYHQSDLKQTKQQITDLKELRSEYQKDMLLLTSERNRELRKVNDLKDSSIFNRERQQVLNRIHKLTSELASRKTETYLAAHKVPTLEQEQELAMLGIFTCNYGYPNPGLMMP